MPSIRSSLLLVFLLQFSLSGQAAVPGALIGSFAPELTAEAALSKTSVTSDDGLLLVGDFEAIDGSLRPGFAKLRPDGSLDPLFQRAVGMGLEPMVSELFSLQNGRVFVEAQGPITVGQFGILDAPPPTRFFLQPDGNLATSPFLEQLDPKHSITPLLEHENRLFVRAPGKHGPELVVLDTTTLLQLDFPQPASWPAVPLDLIAVTNGFWVLGGDSRQHPVTLFKVDADGQLDKAFLPEVLPSRSAHHLLPTPGDGFLLAADDDFLLGPIFDAPQPQSRPFSLHTYDAVGARVSTLSVRVGPRSKVLARRNADGGSLLTSPDGETLVRYTLGGKIDPSFTPIPLGSLTRANSLGGRTTPGVTALPDLPNGLIHVGDAQRYLPDGNPDPFWDPPTLDKAGTVDGLFATDDKFYAAGNFSTVDATPSNRIARFHASGELDSSFSVPHDLPAPTMHGVFPDGSLLVSTNSKPPQLAKLHSDGSVDPEFQLELEPSYQLLEAAVDSSGRIYVLILQFRSVVLNQRTLTRYHSDGSVDESFAHQARPPTDGAWLGFPSALGPVHPLPDGGYLAYYVSHGEGGGYLEALPGVFGSHLPEGWVLLNQINNFSSGEPRILLHRWHPEEGLDESFAAPFLSVGNPAHRGSFLTMTHGLRDGRILTAGILSPEHGDYQFLRLHQNGTPDFAFAPPSAYHLVPAVPGLESIVRKGSLLPATLANRRQDAEIQHALELADGTIVLAGTFTHLGSLRRTGIAAICPGVATNFETWCPAVFARSALPNHLLGPNDDPDNDQASNFYEFAIGSDPLTPETGSSQPQMIGSDPPRWTLPRNPDARVALQIEIADDLQQWRPAGANEVTIETNLTSYLITLNNNVDQAFIRARFTATP